MTNPYIIVFGNEKGGTGKSTLAMHMIVSLLKQGHKVASIDTDARQGTLSRYLANRAKTAETCDIMMPQHVPIFRSEQGEIERANEEDKEHLLQQLESYKDCDYIVIDTPGNDTFLSRLAHSFADTLITPLNDSFIDLDMLVRLEAGDVQQLRPSTYAEMVWDQKKEKARRSGGNMDWIVLRNRLSPLSSKNKEEILKILSVLSKRIGFRLLDGFCERVIFRELFMTGTTLLDLKETDVALTLSHVAAKKELRDLMDALAIPVQKKQMRVA